MSSRRPVFRRYLALRSVAAALAAGGLFALVATTAPAVAQAAPPGAAPGSEPDWVEPPAKVPKLPQGDPTRNLDTLFGALKVAPDETTAKAVENRIWAVWLASGSDTVNLLMARTKAAIDKDDHALAIRLLDAIVEIKPDYVEGWNRRATVFFLKKDYAGALADLRQVLRREPRHFGALAGLGTIMQEIGDEKNALGAYRKALEVNPHLKGMADKVRGLTEKVEGRPI
ncbi:tetratricopeptide repeat protein [Rhodoplanes sp. SY1]|uniref:tetratricopeptide repeat protein n=1 Tax=Rhodoplanes sp. SY1 TaxID=3166646 RepID=UPI0038B643C0